MNTEKTSLENEKQPSCLGAVISCFDSLFESIKVVSILWAFIVMLFGGIVIAPLLSIIKYIINIYVRYYDWLFDWYVSKNSL